MYTNTIQMYYFFILTKNKIVCDCVWFLKQLKEYFLCVLIHRLSHLIQHIIDLITMYV